MCQIPNATLIINIPVHKCVVPRNSIIPTTLTGRSLEILRDRVSKAKDLKGKYEA